MWADAYKRRPPLKVVVQRLRGMSAATMLDGVDDRGAPADKEAGGLHEISPAASALSMIASLRAKNESLCSQHKSLKTKVAELEVLNKQLTVTDTSAWPQYRSIRLRGFV